MEFRNSKGIFQQIADNLCERILEGEFKQGDKINSVREQAANLGVNQNTIMRTYSELQRDGIIQNKRGVGYFVADNAADKIIEARKTEFFENQLPEFIRQVQILKLTKKELAPLLEQLSSNGNQ